MAFSVLDGEVARRAGANVAEGKPRGRKVEVFGYLAYAFIFE